MFSSIRFVHVTSSNSGDQVAKINHFCFSKYNAALSTFIFSLDAKEMLLTNKNDFCHRREIFAKRQNVADVSFSLLLSLKLFW